MGMSATVVCLPQVLLDAVDHSPARHRKRLPLPPRSCSNKEAGKADDRRSTLAEGCHIMGATAQERLLGQHNNFAAVRVVGCEQKLLKQNMTGMPHVIATAKTPASQQTTHL